jgi:hypothetical protein
MISDYLYREDRPVGSRRCICLIVVAGFLILSAGCSSSAEPEERRHIGPKVSVSHFLKNTTKYKGRLISLVLDVDEDIQKSRGQSLRDYLGKNVKFTTQAPSGERVNLVVSIPADLPLPDVGRSDTVFVTMLCTRGNLRGGNEAKLIDFP